MQNGGEYGKSAVRALHFCNVSETWRRNAPPGHAAKKVRIELDRASYSGQARTKEMRTPILGWAFPDTGAQVTLINPAMVRAMGGASLVKNASLLIKDAGGHLMETEGAVFVLISHKDRVNGLVKKTHQMAYVSPQAEGLVLSREAIESLELVSNLDDRKEASVNLVSNSLSPVVKEEAPRVSGSGLHVSRRFESTPAVERHRSAGPDGRSGRATPSTGGSAGASSAQGASSPEYREYEGDSVPGGQLTLDLIAAHNIDFPDSKVSLTDLKPNTDPDFQCKGTVSLKNGFLTCGCHVRAEAPDPLTHREVPGFDNMSNEGLRRFIIKRYMKSGFNNCQIQPLKMMYSDKPLLFFVDPNVKPVAIHKAAIIPIHLKARVKADLDRDVRLGSLEKVDVNSPVKWLSRLIVTMKKDGSP